MGLFDFFNTDKPKETGAASYSTMSDNANKIKKEALIERVLTHLKKQGEKPMASFTPENQARLANKKMVLNKCLDALQGQSSVNDFKGYLELAKQQPSNYTQADGRFYKVSDTAGIVDEVFAFICKTIKFEDLATPLVHADHLVPAPGISPTKL